MAYSTVALAACLLAAAAPTSASQATVTACQDTYARDLGQGGLTSERRCSLIANLTLCLNAASADLTAEATNDVNDYLAIVVAQNKQCVVPNDPGSPPTIVTNDDNLAITVGSEKEVVFHRFRRETVSLFELTAKVDQCDEKIAESEARVTAATKTAQDALVSLANQHVSTLGSRLAEMVTQQTAGLAASVSTLSDRLNQVDEKVAEAVKNLCNPYQYQAGSECKPLKLCAGTQYQETAPTADSDRVCKAYRTCKSTQFETKGPTATSDRECTEHTKCSSSSEYVFAPGTLHRDAICRKLTVCGSGESESIKPTASSDRACGEGKKHASCKELYSDGQRTNGIYTIYPDNVKALKVYCYQSFSGGGWTLVMRVSTLDGAIDFRHNAEGWRRASYSDVGSINMGSQSGNKDYISQAYDTMKVDDILVANSISTPRLSVWATGCLTSRSLRSILQPNTKPSNGYACCNGINYGSGTPKTSGYNTLLLNGDEGADNEPAKIAIRTSCSGDSASLHMGYTRSSHGNREVWSQGNQWGALTGMFVFVR